MNAYTVKVLLELGSGMWAKSGVNARDLPEEKSTCCQSLFRGWGTAFAEDGFRVAKLMVVFTPGQVGQAVGAGLRVGAKCPARAAPTQHHGWVPGPLLGFGAPAPVGNRPREKPAPVRQDLNLSGSALKAICLLGSGDSNLLGNAAWQEWPLSLMLSVHGGHFCAAKGWGVVSPLERSSHWMAAKQGFN